MSGATIVGHERCREAVLGLADAAPAGHLVGGGLGPPSSRRRRS